MVTHSRFRDYSLIVVAETVPFLLPVRISEVEDVGVLFGDLTTPNLVAVRVVRLYLQHLKHFLSSVALLVCISHEEEKPNIG